ncbi:MAG: type III pantothenate kinase [Parasporobacterium sp.]|nr:type III pantothenate kinase [Parasporobacterium sp.]
MLLAIDVGNTNIMAALFEGDEMAASFRMTTQTPRTSDEFGIMLTSLIRSNGYDEKQIDAVIIASVVPVVMHALINASIKFFGTRPLVVGPGTKTGIRLIRTNPAEVGPDRIVDAVAALAIYGGPVIVVDYGTATTFDYFTADGAFEAGVTCPGIMLSLRALWSGTAMLPEIQVKDPGTIMAKNTETSLQAGILYGKIGEAEYIIDRLKAESGVDPETIKVVATGGLAATIADATDRIQYLEPNLTMYGLKIIYDRNK